MGCPNPRPRLKQRHVIQSNVHVICTPAAIDAHVCHRLIHVVVILSTFTHGGSKSELVVSITCDDDKTEETQSV